MHGRICTTGKSCLPVVWTSPCMSSQPWLLSVPPWSLLQVTGAAVAILSSQELYSCSSCHDALATVRCGEGGACCVLFSSRHQLFLNLPRHPVAAGRALRSTSLRGYLGVSCRCVGLRSYAACCVAGTDAWNACGCCAGLGHSLCAGGLDWQTSYMCRRYLLGFLLSFALLLFFSCSISLQHIFGLALRPFVKRYGETQRS